MVNKKFRLGILVMALVFGMTVVGCESPVGSSEDNPYELTDGVYEQMKSSVDEESGDSTQWFSFTASSSTAYFLAWDDFPGSGNYTCDIAVSAFMSDGSTVLNGIDRINEGYYKPMIISGYTGTVRIKVSSMYGKSGTYAIKYTSDDNGTMETAITLNHGVSFDSSIDPSGDVDWYKIEPTGGSYTLSWDDFPGSGNYTCDTFVSAFTSDGSTIVDGINREYDAYWNPKTITYTGTVYVKVSGSIIGRGSGTYKITCSD